MRDLKHFTGKKRLFRFPFRQPRQRTPANAFRRAEQPPRDPRRLRLVLTVLAVLLAAYPLASLLISARSASSSVQKAPSAPAPVASPDRYRNLDGWQSLLLATEHLGNARYDGSHFVAPLADGGSLVYGIDSELQERVTQVMEQFRVPYGVFVALDPKTGRVLAMASRSTVDPRWAATSFQELFPMASLFKIVTAAAALEQKKVTPSTVVAFGGKLTSESPRYWCVKPSRHAQQMDLTTAMGKSVNPVFGRLAGEVVGREQILSSAERFGFNQILFPGSSSPLGRAQAPETLSELMLMGAGLCREVKISPLHAASLMAGIANNGMMMMPVLVDGIIDGKGDRVYSGKSQGIRQVVSPEIARQLGEMLSTTVNSGTSRKAFHDRRGRAKFASLRIAAKTGSISGTSPEGHYSWFAAYAPMEDPQIALAALVINQDKWKIKASYLGEQALEAFFK